MIGRLRRFDASLAEPLEQLGARALGIDRHGAQLRGYAATQLLGPTRCDFWTTRAEPDQPQRYATIRRMAKVRRSD